MNTITELQDIIRKKIWFYYKQQWKVRETLATGFVACMCEVIAICDYDKVQEVNLTKATENKNKCIVRAIAKGKPIMKDSAVRIGNNSYKIY